jgi:hypothetical protein
LPEIKRDIQVNITEPLQSYFTSAFVSVGVAIGQALGAALSGGNVGDIFNGLFATLAKGIEQLGQQMIEIGLLGILAQSALSQILLNPFAAIAVGIALTALGSAISNAMNRSQFAVGTRNAPGGMALVVEIGPELVKLPGGSLVIPETQTAQMLGGAGGRVEVYGVLRGQDIFFSNRKYSQTYNRQT